MIRGYLTERGRVVQNAYITAPSSDNPALRFPAPTLERRAAHGNDLIIGTIHYREERFNLRRVLVVRSWWVELNDGDRLPDRSTRREAIAVALSEVARRAL